MKYDDMSYSNNDWKGDRDLLSEAYEDLYKVYAERNKKLQHESREGARKRSDKPEEEWHRKWREESEKLKRDQGPLQGTIDNTDPDPLPGEGYGPHGQRPHPKVRHHSDVQEEDDDEYEEGAENVRREGDVLEKKELLLGDDEDDLDDDDDERDLRDVWKQTQDEEDDEKKKKKRSEMKKKVAQAVSSNYDEFGLGTWEEKTKEITLNELWAISGTGEDIWTESGDSTNEMKTKVGDTVYFTWNYRPNDKDSCRSLCRAKIVS